jgi:uncharacterized protein YecE (DUF72 family)
MYETLPLFDDETEPSLKQKLKRRLSVLAEQRLYLGTSSWKYEGWLGQVYSPERYLVRGRFSKQRFEQDCLSEYAETFPIVCGDFSFYQFPTAQFWANLFARTSHSLLHAFKAPDEITVACFPRHSRYGGRAGALNPNFLNAELLGIEFLNLLLRYRERVPLIIFEFGAFPAGFFTSGAQWAEALLKFLSQLPRHFRYAVEIRNPEFLDDSFLRALRETGVAHVLSSWTRMPSLHEQMNLPGVFTAPFSVCRALLRPGRDYNEAVRRFSPYREVQEPNEDVRNALRSLLYRSKTRAEPIYIFVNNRLEGNAPGTIEAVMDFE